MTSSETEAPVPLDPADRLHRLLGEMAEELRSQFETFRDLRRAAEEVARGGDEAAARLARADLKAATEAVGLILRSLEKIDQLQRQLAEEAAAPDAPEPGYDEARAHFLALIDARAEEKAEALLAKRLALPPPAGVATGEPTAPAAQGAGAVEATAEAGSGATSPPLKMGDG